MVVFDTSIFVLAINSNAPAPRAEDGKAISHPHERVIALVEKLTEQRSRVLLPAPVLAEALVRASAVDADRIMKALGGSAAIEIAPFDGRAAIEVAEMGRAQLRRRGVNREVETYAKLKYDRQIVAIAKVNNAAALYSSDSGLCALARGSGVTCIRLEQIQLPPHLMQRNLGI